MRLVVFQHEPEEHPGFWRELLRGEAAEVLTAEMDASQPIPPLETADALLVLGGPMSANDADSCPWLPAEIAAVREVATAGLPVLGVCLGAQILAKALGGSVARNPQPELGLLEVELTEAGAVDLLFRGWPRSAAVIEWHCDTFTVPPGGVLLATSPTCRNQAFRYGTAAYGVQFHPEATPDMVAAWCHGPDYETTLRQLRSPPESDPFSDVPESAAGLAQRARLLYANFRSLVARAGRA